MRADRVAGIVPAIIAMRPPRAFSKTVRVAQRQVVPAIAALSAADHGDDAAADAEAAGHAAERLAQSDRPFQF